jgi:hypothetical protein
MKLSLWMLKIGEGFGLNSAKSHAIIGTNLLNSDVQDSYIHYGVSDQLAWWNWLYIDQGY